MDDFNFNKLENMAHSMSKILEKLSRKEIYSHVLYELLHRHNSSFLPKCPVWSWQYFNTDILTHS